MTKANPAWAYQIMPGVAAQDGTSQQKRKNVVNRRKPISAPWLAPQQHGQLVRGTADGAGRRRAPTTGGSCGCAPLDDGWRVGIGTAWSRYPPPLRSIRCRRLAGHIGRMKERIVDHGLRRRIAGSAFGTGRMAAQVALAAAATITTRTRRRANATRILAACRPLATFTVAATVIPTATLTPAACRIRQLQFLHVQLALGELLDLGQRLLVVVDHQRQHGRYGRCGARSPRANAADRS